MGRSASSTGDSHVRIALRTTHILGSWEWTAPGDSQIRAAGQHSLDHPRGTHFDNSKYIPPYASIVARKCLRELPYGPLYKSRPDHHRRGALCAGVSKRCSSGVGSD